MIVKDVANILQELAPLKYAEDFDNVDLLVGDPERQVSGILVTLDTLENVVDEALAKDCNLIVSFHPIIFSGLKKLNGSTYVERAVIKAIENRIAIYCVHTALDNSPVGVNAKICEVLNIQNPGILLPKKGMIQKLVTYVSTAEAPKLKDALFEAGAGALGDYSHCSFSVEGTGSFMAGANANPYKGTSGELHLEPETQINVVFNSARKRSVLKALRENHPYEEIAYEVYKLENDNREVGMGMIGELSQPVSEKVFLETLKQKMNVPTIRHSALLGRDISRVAVLGGSGAFAIEAARVAGADIFVTADIKYHQYFLAEGKMVIADIGHYETEQFTKNLLVDYLTKKIPNFAVSLAESVTNPIKYS